MRSQNCPPHGAFARIFPERLGIDFYLSLRRDTRCHTPPLEEKTWNASPILTTFTRRMVRCISRDRESGNSWTDILKSVEYDRAGVFTRQ